MVDSIGGFTQQVPGSNIFRPGEDFQGRAAGQDQSGKSRSNQQATGTDNLNVLENTNKLDDGLLLSKNDSRPDPNKVSSSVNRGSNFDITV